MRKEGSEEKKKVGPFGPILAVLLLAVILGAGYFALQFRDSLESKRSEYEAALELAGSELAEAQAEYALADPDAAENAAERDELAESMLGEARERAAELEAESAALDESIAEAESRVAELEAAEDFDYYKAVYDAYAEGMAYVEELLSGD